jgi:hypothetical protein
LKLQKGVMQTISGVGKWTSCRKISRDLNTKIATCVSLHLVETLCCIKRKKKKIWTECRTWQLK